MSNITDVVDAWGRAAQRPDYRTAIHPTGADDTAYRASGIAAAELVAGLIGPDARTIVDFGAGDGRVTIPLANIYDRVIALDAVPALLEHLNAEAPNIETFRSNGLDIHLLGIDIDAVVMLAVLIHHRHADATKIVASAARALGPGGRIIVDLAVCERSREPSSYRDISAWTRPELEALAAGTGTRIVHATTYPGAVRWDRPLDPVVLEVERDAV